MAETFMMAVMVVAGGLSGEPRLGEDASPYLEEI
jgi:hypothetical protein